MEAKNKKLTLKQRSLILKKKHSTFHFLSVAVLAGVLAILLAGLSVVDALHASSGAQAAQSKDTSKSSADGVFSAVFVGNMNFGRNESSVSDGYGFDTLFGNTLDVLDGADYAFGNLECTLVKNIKNYKKTDGKDEYFYASDKVAESLYDAGFTAVQVANNHTVDYGKKGLAHTISSLSKAGVTPVGAGEDLPTAQEPALTVADGLVVKTIAATDVPVTGTTATLDRRGVLTFDSGDVYQMVHDASETADLVVVGAHWGYEYSRQVSEDQQSIAHALIDAGADIVIGTHADSLQPIERYKDGIIFYDLGNFISDDTYVRARDSVAVRLNVQKDGSAEFELTPLRIKSGIPGVTSDPLSTARTWSMLTRQLDPDSYEMRDNVMHIPFATINRSAYAAIQEEERANDAAMVDPSGKSSKIKIDEESEED